MLAKASFDLPAFTVRIGLKKLVRERSMVAGSIIKSWKIFSKTDWIKLESSPSQNFQFRFTIISEGLRPTSNQLPKHHQKPHYL
jgi:hypothetical protein